MMTRNDWTPLVVLAILLLIGACLFGMVASGSELFNTSQLRQAADAQATAESIANDGKQAYMEATKSALAATQAYEGILNENRKAPAQATLQAGYWQATLNAANAQATLTNLERQGKADERQEQFNTISQYMAVAAALVMAGVLVALTVLLGKYVRAREREAEASFMAEKRIIEQAQAAAAAPPARPVPSNGRVKEAPVTKQPANWQQKAPDYNKVK